MRQRSRSVHLPLLFVLSACGPGEEFLEAELPPELRSEDSTSAAVLSCTPSSATGYRGGRPAEITLVEVDGKPLEINTANAFIHMREAAAREGVHLRIVSGFRSYEEQDYLYHCYQSCSCNQCNLAAPPGYSNHNSGIAIDLNTHETGVERWLFREEHRFGFSATVPSEPWHHEYVGGPLSEPCAPAGSRSGAPAKRSVRLLVPSEGGHYRNGVWFRTEAPGAHHVRYSADGYRFGASEDAEAEFALRYTFHVEGTRRVTARAFDEWDRVIGEHTIRIEVRPGDSPDPSLGWRIEEGAWLRNGVWMTVDAPSGTAMVDYTAGPYRVGESVDPDSGFASRAVFHQPGFRVLTARAKNLHGKVLAQSQVTVLVLPGDESGVGPGVRFVRPLPGSASRSISLQAAGSVSVTRMVYSADGWQLGESAEAASLFPIEYRFDQAGLRKLRASGFDRDGREVAHHEIEIYLEP